MNTKRVLITGYGAISPFGIGAEKMFQALFDNRSAVVNVREQWGSLAKSFNCHVAAPLQETPDPREVPRTYRRNMGPLAILAYRACVDALAHAGLAEGAVGSPGLGVVYSSTTGSAASLEESFRVYLDETQRVLPSAGSFFKIMSHTCSANIAHSLGIRGVSYSVSSACASSTQAIGLGAELVRTGRQDIVLCGGADELHPLSVLVFDMLQAASWSFNDRPQDAPRPFDARRDGTVLGAGAGTLVLESEESALRRRARVYGEIVGYQSNTDPGSMAQSSAESIVACLRGALDDAGVGPEAVDYINAHATATIAGDITEAQAIAEVFRGLEVPVSSLKGHMGHTLAAAGVLETIASLEMMRRGRLIPTRNLDEPLPEAAGLRHVPPAGQDKTLRCIMKNSFAFGGVNAVLIIKEYAS